MIRVTVLTPLIVFGCSLQAIGQSPSPSDSPAAREGELKLVVALFRHGVRAPLKQIDDDPTKKPHAGKPWPELSQWGATNWGYLTPHGHDLAKALGNYYAKWYTTKEGWPQGFKAYLWADTDPRTIDSANALAQGFEQGGIPEQDVTLRFLETKITEPPTITTDPLFHPFKAKCGSPDTNKLERTVAKINKAREEAAKNLRSSFEDLYGALNCFAALSCLPLKTLGDNAVVCGDPNSSCKAKTCESPISWYGTVDENCPPGEWPYASTASETFLLEYANNMTPSLVGWGRVDAAKNLLPMMQLHEKYFDFTEREPYLAQIGGSNLVREILDQLNRKAGRVEPIDGKCPRGNKESQFIGLIGHDTNLANVNTLLKLGWKFDNKDLPPDTFGLPGNDALPAGALVFELRQRNGKYHVRVEYVTQSLDQMRKGPTGNAFRLPVQGGPCGQTQPCEMSLDTFNTLVANALGPDDRFLSRCSDGNEVCQ